MSLQPNMSDPIQSLLSLFDQIFNQSQQKEEVLEELMGNEWNSTGVALATESLSTDHIYEDDVRVIACWTLIGSFGVATNILILICIINNRRMCGAASYWFIMSLSVCDISMLIVYFAHLVPATTLHDTYFTTESLPNAIGIFIYDVFWYSGVLHLVLMAGNRYCNICYPKVYHQVFTKRNTLLLILLALLLGVVVSTPGLFECCRLIYNHNIYAAQYNPITTGYSYVDITLNSVSILVMIFCYVQIVIKVRSSRMVVMRYSGDGLALQSLPIAKKGLPTLLPPRPQTLCVRAAPPKISRREMRLLFQFCSVSTIFLLTWSTWQWLPYMSNSKWVGFAVTSLFYINNCTNPTIYLIFNSQLRREVKRLLCCRQKEKKSTDKTKIEKKLPVKKLTSLKPDYPLVETSELPSVTSCQIQPNDSSIGDDEKSDSSDISLDSGFAAALQPEPNSVLREFIAAQMALPCAILKAGNQAQKPMKRPRKSATFSSVDSSGNIRGSIGTVITTATADGNMDLSPMHLAPPTVEFCLIPHIDDDDINDLILPVPSVPSRPHKTSVTSSWVTTV